ncbi:MAG: toprim domain-containing protein, partial [Vibrionaceae bacterium]
REYSQRASNAQELRDLQGVYAKARIASDCEYLIKDRLLSAELLAQCSDARFGTSSAMFFHKNEQGLFTGYEYRSAKAKGFCKGGKKSLFTLNTGSEQKTLVIVESAINCFSYAQLLQRAGRPLEHKIISTAGRYSAAQAEQIKALALAVGGKVILAHDNDLKGEGDIQAQALSKMLEQVGIESKRHKPQLNDWNDYLIAQAERA